MPDLLPFLGEVALRSSLVLATAFALLFVMKRASASERHVVLVLGLLMTALVPAGFLLSPKITWTISVPYSVESSVPTQNIKAYLASESQSSLPQISSPVVNSKPSLLDALTVTNGLIAFLMAGMLVQCLMLGQAVRVWRRVGHRAVKALLPDGVLEKARIFAGVRTIPPIFTSDQITVPLLSGWLQPSIILPSEAARWPSKRLLMAVCHELAHFRRGDSLLLPLICFSRVLYWWHPLIWLALARLRRERENACDDLVLNQNFRATDYADLIVSTARQAQALRWQDGALAMASSSNVGERIGAILNPRLNRRQASRTMVCIGLILTFALGWFFVAAQVEAEEQPATLGSKATTDPSKPQIKLEFRWVGIDEKTYLSHQKEIDAAVANSDLASLITTANNLPGISMLSAPSVTTQEGLKANVDIVREMPFATKFDKDKDGKIVPSDFKTRDLGVSVEALPILTADGKYVNLKLKCQVKSFCGWKETSPGVKLPIFNTASIETGRLIDKHGMAVWVGGPGTTHAYLPEKDGNTETYTKNALPKRILLLVMAQPMPAEIQVPVIPSNAMVQVSLKYFQISEKTYSKQPFAIEEALGRGDMSYFNHLPGCLRLAEPVVSIKMGVQGTVSAKKEITYPVKFVLDHNGKFIPSDVIGKRSCGISVTLTPSLSANGEILLKCFDEITTYEGMIDSGYMASTGSNEKQPVFNVSRKQMELELSTGKPLGHWARTNFEDQSKSMSWKPGDPPSVGLHDAPKVRIGTIMTANLYSADGSPIPPPLMPQSPVPGIVTPHLNGFMWMN